MPNPSDCRFTKEHEWVYVDGDVGTVGITDYAQDQLGDVVYVDMPQPGQSLKQFDKMGEIESVKTVSDLYTPVSGEVSEVNGAVSDRPELVNKDPFGEGWLVKVRLSSKAELQALMSPDDYDAFTAAEREEE